MADSNAQQHVKAAIAEYLTLRNIPPSPAWIQSFMPTIRVNTPIQALQKTAVFRLLSTDLTNSIQRSQSNAIPANASNPGTKERKLAGPIVVQILDIEDIGHSRWSQVEAIEAHERGETTKGREIIRVVPDDQATSDQSNNAPASTGPHKLLLQDAHGTKIYGFELIAVNGINFQQLSIGAKLVLKDVMVARGMIMLEPRCVEALGGKVDAWDRKWRADRKEDLKRTAGMGAVSV